MKKVYYLATCDTCKRILKAVTPPSDFVVQDIKKDPITTEQLEELKELAGSFEALFSKRARRYKERKLKNESLSELQIRDLILEHYTFLKRPVIINNDKIFIGNSAKTIAAATSDIHG